MNRSSLRNNRLKFKASRKLPVILDESMEFTSNEYQKKLEDVNVLPIGLGNTRFANRLCPKISLDIELECVNWVWVIRPFFKGMWLNIWQVLAFEILVSVVVGYVVWELRKLIVTSKKLKCYVLVNVGTFNNDPPENIVPTWLLPRTCGQQRCLWNAVFKTDLVCVKGLPYQSPPSM